MKMKEIEVSRRVKLYPQQTAFTRWPPNDFASSCVGVKMSMSPSIATSPPLPLLTFPTRPSYRTGDE